VEPVHFGSDRKKLRGSKWCKCVGTSKAGTGLFPRSEICGVGSSEPTRRGLLENATVYFFFKMAAVGRHYGALGTLRRPSLIFVNSRLRSRQVAVHFGGDRTGGLGCGKLNVARGASGGSGGA
jgi:hypothetical protein